MAKVTYQYIILFDDPPTAELLTEYGRMGWRLLDKSDAWVLELATTTEEVVTPRQSTDNELTLEKRGYISTDLDDWEKELYDSVFTIKVSGPLRRAGVQPMYLFQMEDKQLLAIRGIGDKSLEEIRQKMDQIKARYRRVMPL